MSEELNSPATQAGFGRFVGISRQAVSMMVKKGVLSETGTYQAWLHQYIRHLRASGSERIASESNSDPLKQARTRETEMRADGLELDIQEKAADLVPADLVTELQQEREAALSVALDDLFTNVGNHYRTEHGLDLTKKDNAFLRQSMQSVIRHMQTSTA